MNDLETSGPKAMRLDQMITKNKPEEALAFLQNHPGFDNFGPQTEESDTLSTIVEMTFIDELLEKIGEIPIEDLVKWRPLIWILPRTYHIRILVRYKSDLDRLEALFPEDMETRY